MGRSSGELERSSDTERSVGPFEEIFEDGGTTIIATTVGVDPYRWQSLTVDAALAERAVFHHDEVACRELIRVAKSKWGVPKVVYLSGDSKGWMLANAGDADPSST